jgi:hypothetical protein
MPPDNERDYEVGYGKPPRHTRFKPGRSGNPRGRPSGSKNLSTLLNEALNEPVIVAENGGQRKISKRRAIRAMSPPQAGQVQAPSCTGSCTIACRGRWSGKGLRFGRSPSRIGSGGSSAAALLISSASPASSSSSRSSSCSICRASRSEERPNCIRRSLAIWSLSFSISRVRSWRLCQVYVLGTRNGCIQYSDLLDVQPSISA